MTPLVFLGEFDIEGFGETLADELVMTGFHTLDKFLGLTENEIEGAYGFAEILTYNFMQGLGENVAEMRRPVQEEIITIESSPGKKL